MENSENKRGDNQSGDSPSEQRSQQNPGDSPAYLRALLRWLSHSIVDLGSNVFTFVLVLLVLLGTFLGSESGRLWLLQSALPDMLNELGLELISKEPATNHLGHWSFKHLTLLNSGDIVLTADELAFSVNLPKLLTGRVHIDTLRADYLQLNTSSVVALAEKLGEADHPSQDSPATDWQSIQLNDLVPVRVSEIDVQRLQLSVSDDKANENIPDAEIPAISIIGNLDFAWRDDLLNGQLSISALDSSQAKLNFSGHLTKELVGEIELSVKESSSGWLANQLEIPATSPLDIALKATVTKSEEIWRIQMQKLTMPLEQHRLELTGVIKANKPRGIISTDELKLMVDDFPQTLNGWISREQIAITTEINALPVNITSMWQDELRGGSLTGIIEVSGTPDAPIVQSTVELASGYQNLPLEIKAEVTASLGEREAEIILQTVSGQLGELSISKGSGLLDLYAQTLDLKVASAETPLSYLRLLDVHPIEDLEVVLKANNVSVKGPFVAPSYSGEALAVGHYKKQSFTATSGIHGDIHGLQAKSFELFSGESQVFASGEIDWSGEQLNLAVTAEQLPLSLLQLLEISLPVQVNARVASEGTVKGAFQAPEYSGNIAASGQYYQSNQSIPFELNAVLKANPNKVVVQQSLLTLDMLSKESSSLPEKPDNLGKTSLRARGEVLVDQQTIDATLNFSELPLSVAELAGITVPYESSGTFAGDLQVNGSFSAPELAGRLEGSGDFASRPFDVQMEGGGNPKDFLLDSAKLFWGDTQLEGAGSYRSGNADFSVALSNFNLSELGVFGIDVLPADLAFDLDIAGSRENPDIQGNVDISLQSADPDNAGNPIRLGVDAVVALNQDLLTVKSQLYQDDTSQGNMEITIPWSDYLQHLQRSEQFLTPDLPLTTSIVGEMDLTWLEKILAQNTHQMDGIVSFDVITTGVLTDPMINGTIGLRGGRYQNRLTRTSLEEGELQLFFAGQRLDIGTVKASDGDRGRLIAQGFVDWSEQTASEHSGEIDITVTTRDIQLLRRDELEGEASGRLEMVGDFKRLLINGDVEVSPLRIVLDILNDSSIPELDIVVREEAQQVDNESNIFSLPEVELNVVMRASQQAYVRGRGLNAELEGLVRIAGNLDDPDYRGKFAIVRGTFDLFGKRFDLAEGDMLFENETVSIYIEGRHIDDEYEYLVTISGGFNDLEVELSTLPDSPQDEAISRLLFGKSVQSITPFQAIRLAQAAQELTGGSSGFDPISSTRDVLQLDNLTVDSAKTDSGTGVSVGVGKYINERVYVELQRSADAAQPWQGSIEVELTPKLVLEGTSDEVGGTSVDLKWKYDY